MPTSPRSLKKGALFRAVLKCSLPRPIITLNKFHCEFDLQGLA